MPFSFLDNNGVHLKQKKLNVYARKSVNESREPYDHHISYSVCI